MSNLKQTINLSPALWRKLLLCMVFFYCIFLNINNVLAADQVILKTNNEGKPFARQPQLNNNIATGNDIGTQGNIKAQNNTNIQDKELQSENNLEVQNTNKNNESITKIEQYLNNLTSFTASFTQIDSQNNIATGQFYLSRPGKLLWQYQNPEKLIILGNNNNITYYDPELDEVTKVNAADHIASFLMRKKINLHYDIKVLDIYRNNDVINITMAQKDEEDAGFITLGFQSAKMQLTQMNITDAVGKTTYINFDNIKENVAIDNNIYKLPNLGIRKGRAVHN